MMLIHTILWFAYFWIYLIIVWPVLIYVQHLRKKGDIKRHDEIALPIIQRWAKRLLKLAGASVTVLGTENIPSDDTAAVFVSNHQGYFDIPLCISFLGNAKGLVAKKEIKKIPLIRSWMEELGCVFIDRENPRASVAALNEASERVAQGYSMVIFPEGTRSKTGEMGEFKGGAFRVAQKNKVPVVPFFIDGSDYLLEQNGFRIKPHAVTISILPAIDTSEYSREDWKALPELTQHIVGTALYAHRGKVYDKEKIG